MSFPVGHAALQALITHRRGRTRLLTNRGDWTSERGVAAYAGQQELAQVFWSDRKIRVHAGYCLRDLSLRHDGLRQAPTFWPQLRVEERQEELAEIPPFVPLYPALGGGPPRTASVLATRNLGPEGRAETLGLQQRA